MDYCCSSREIKFAAFIVNVLAAAAAAINGAHGYTMVSGTVFCDQCKDGQISLFDYPLRGVKVMLTCPRRRDMRREETTKWLGNYAIRFDGTPNLNGCYIQISAGKDDKQSPEDRCGAIAGPAEHLKQVIKMFDMEIYGVDPLLAKPSKPASFCSKYKVPLQSPSACSVRKWMMPEFRCHWKALRPEGKVGEVFGTSARHRYGSNLTLMEGLMGRGEPYKTLLREGIASLLNSCYYYDGTLFTYRPYDVLARMNLALRNGSTTRQVLGIALRFMMANNGKLMGIANNSTCTFTACK